MSRDRRNNRDLKSRTANRYRGLPDDDDGTETYDHSRRRGGVSGGLLGRVSAAPNATKLLQRLVERRQREETRGVAGRSENRPQVYLVKFMKAGKTSVDTIYKAVSQRMANFKPYLMRPDERGNMIMYVADEEAAEALKGMSRRICDPKSTDTKFVIVSMKTSAPWNKIPAENLEFIKRAVHSRFNEATMSLDLTDFSSDREFTSNGVLVALTRNEVMVAVADIIDEHFSGIKALSLRNNRLRTLDYVANLIYRAPVITTLDLSNNPIEKKVDLKKLQGWNIETLFLADCPVTSTFSDAMEYTRAVHEVFPAVTSLDGQAVTRQIDITEKIGGSGDRVVELPVVRSGFTPDSQVEAMIKKFVLEYLGLYDGEGGRKTRQKLFNAYDEDATFTVVQETMHDGVSWPEYPDQDAQKYYRRNSHNILSEERWKRYREKIVRKGRMAIAAELSQMPLTTHIMDSLVLDIFSMADNFLSFSLQGLLRDGSQAFKNDGDMCYFSRTFVVLPRGEGQVVIANDMLCMSAASDLTVTRYKHLLTKASVAAVQEPQPATEHQTTEALAQMNVNGPVAVQQPPAPIAAPVYDVNDLQIRNQMVEQFCIQSGMKPEWAMKCLEDQNWNYEAAGQVFMNLKDQIPKDAFQ